MFRIFRKSKQKAGAVRDVQMRPIEQSGVDPLEQRLEDTRRQLGKRLGSLLTGPNINPGLGVRAVLTHKSAPI